MSDVFVSYKRENQVAVGRMVDALRAEGLNVWWDVDVPPSAAWEQTIERQLAEARVVIVAWSAAAVASENVKAEARWARRQDRLLQVYLDQCEPPLFFGERQGLDLRAWTGTASDRTFRALVDAIRRGGDAKGVVPKPADSWTGAGEPEVIPPAMAPGMVLNGMFEVQRLVGTGGLGSLYEGVSLTTGERVAIKVMRRELAELPVIKAGFSREMRAQSKLNHPVIVTHRLAAREPSTGALYIVDEFIDAIMLDALIGQVTMPEQRLRALITRLAGALKYAHDAGVLHRQLDASNIFLPAGGLEECRIVDFSISADVELMMRTRWPRAYAAPEQWGDDGGGVGTWTDVYSLGLIVFALATGVRPPPVAPGEVQSDRATKGPELSRAPPRLRSVLDAMLRLDPCARLRTMDEVLESMGRPGR